MFFIIGLLTLIMALDCLVLVFLVLIQLPKKEAGAGLAFGGAASDALFGAGSGTVLTKITKYAATTFFLLSLILSVLQSRFHHRTASEFERKLNQAARPTLMPTPAPAPAPATAPATAPSVVAPALTSAVPSTNLVIPTPPPVEDTNVPPAGTNK